MEQLRLSHSFIFFVQLFLGLARGSRWLCLKLLMWSKKQYTILLSVKVLALSVNFLRAITERNNMTKIHIFLHSRLRKVKMDQRQLMDSSSTITDMARVRISYLASYRNSNGSNKLLISPFFLPTVKNIGLSYWCPFFSIYF